MDNEKLEFRGHKYDIKYQYDKIEVFVVRPQITKEENQKALEELGRVVSLIEKRKITLTYERGQASR